MRQFDTLFARAALRLLPALAAFALGGGLLEPARAEPLVIAAFGDSLSAGYQLAPEDAFPAQLERALKARGHDVRVLNASVSGDTTTSGLARLDWSLGEEVDAAIVELGANDALRGLPVDVTRENLEAIVGRLKERGITVLLAGMRAPRNMGEDYAEAFDAIYPELARRQDVLLYPYFLQGIPVSPETVMADGMHPTGAGVALIVEGILPDVEALISRAKGERAPRG